MSLNISKFLEQLILFMSFQNLHDCKEIFWVCLAKHLKSTGSNVVLDPADFHCMDKNIVQNLQKKESHAALESHEGE